MSQSLCPHANVGGTLVISSRRKATRKAVTLAGFEFASLAHNLRLISTASSCEYLGINSNITIFICTTALSIAVIFPCPLPLALSLRTSCLPSSSHLQTLQAELLVRPAISTLSLQHTGSSGVSL
jgi:hypothetical protein